MGKGEIGPVGVGVGVVDDRYQESKLVGVSGGLRRERIRRKGNEPFRYRSISPWTRKEQSRRWCQMPL